MRLLFFLVLIMNSCLTLAQTGLVEFPYNPDANNDDIIGTVDLLSLLEYYGDEFVDESLYIANDSTTALYFFTGNRTYGNCVRMCETLPGNWQVTNLNAISKFNPNDDSPIAHTWLSGEALLHSDYQIPTFRLISDGYNQYGSIGWNDGDWQRGCVCMLQQRPRVEYSNCSGNSPLFEECAELRASEGWYPLGGIQIMAYNGVYKAQSFWRWMEPDGE